MLESEAVEVVKQFNLMVDYKDAIIFIMDYIEENDYIISCAYDAIGRDEMRRFFFADFEELVFLIISSAEKEAGINLNDDYKKYLCLFYTEALAGILVEWIKNRRERNRQQVTEYLVKTIKESLLGILEQNM